jgi:hypothetical protein
MKVTLGRKGKLIKRGRGSQKKSKVLVYGGKYSGIEKNHQKRQNSKNGTLKDGSH